MSKIKVFIDGNTGTTGLRLRERLEGFSDVELLLPSEEDRKQLHRRIEYVLSSDFTFLCLPDAASRELVSALPECDTVVLDASTAYRTTENFAYGFPELSNIYRKKIESFKRIAVPGCHASGFCALVAPLVAEGVLGGSVSVPAFSLTGYSGGGKPMIEEYKNSSRPKSFNSPRVYALGQTHKHLPEMKKHCGLVNEPIFSPIVSDFYSGMSVNVLLERTMLKKAVEIEEILHILQRHYATAKTIKVAKNVVTDGMLAANMLEGSDGMVLFVCGNNDRITLTSIFDNLGKGASGAALQCFNIASKRPEESGLNLDFEGACSYI